MTPLLLLTAFTASAAQLESIEVEVGRPAHGSMVGVVDVPIEEVFAIVMDCESTGEWFPDLDDTRLVAADRCAGRTDLPWPIADRTWEIDLASDGVGTSTWEASFAYVAGSGNLAAMHGRYLLEATDDGRTRVTYEAWIDLGFWIPEPLVSWATKRVLPGVLEGIEQEAASSFVASL
jgi:carbon monoxide dehydrogenase subunit G